MLSLQIESLNIVFLIRCDNVFITWSQLAMYGSLHMKWIFRNEIFLLNGHDKLTHSSFCKDRIFPLMLVSQGTPEQCNIPSTDCLCYLYFFKDTIFMWHSLNFAESLRVLPQVFVGPGRFGSFACGGGKHQGFPSGRNYQDLCLTHVFHW